MKNKWEKIWLYLSGKKRNIGLLGLTLIQEVPEIEQSMSHGWFIALKVIIYALAGGGILHGDIKRGENSVTKKVVKNINQMVKKSPIK